MNHYDCKCRRCKGNLLYRVATNVALKIMGQKVYWCHKCDVNTCVWPWTETDSELLDHHKKI